MYVAVFYSDKELTGDEALKKILPHLSKKISKALSLINTLFGSSLKTVSSEFILYTLLLIHENFEKIIDMSDFKLVSDIFSKIQEKERDIFDEVDQKLFDLFSFSDQDRALIIKTDDSFEVKPDNQFDNILSKKTEKYTNLHNLITSMSFVFSDANKEKQPKEDSSQMPIEEVQEFWKPLSIKLDCLRTEKGSMEFFREAFIDLMRTSIEQLATKRWAKSSVSTFVKEIFYNRDGFFNKEQLQQIDELMAALNNDSVLTSRKGV